MPFGRFGMFAVTLVHDFPSRDTCTLPSSVPAYSKLGRLGDSANDTIVGHATMPSFLEIVMSLPFTPIVTISSRLALVVRSPPTASHVCPLFDERNTRLPDANKMLGLCMDSTRGVSQLNRMGASPGAAIGRIDTVSPVTRSTRTMLPSCDSA